MLVLLFSVSAITIVNFSEFNVLFKRLGDTRVEEGLIDSRSVIWPLAWDRITDKPILGHGPRLRLINEEERSFPAGHEFMPYPHSLYLYLLYTLGIIGLIFYLAFFLRLLFYFKSMLRVSLPDMFEKNVPRLAVLLWIVILIDQVKVSAFRFYLGDYQHYLFALFAALLAATFYLRRQTAKLNQSRPA